jgi:RNA polymerase sigma factor (sigma-70 family)
VDDPSANLLARWRAGDQQAATELFQRYAERLVALAQSRLPAKLAGRVDAEDIVQSVYRSFFIAARNGRYVLERSGDLWRLLLAITLHKVHHQVRHHVAGKRAIGLEQACGQSSGAEPPIEALAQGPSPADAAALSDLLEQAFDGIDPLQRRMIELRLQGCRLDEIATDTGRCVHTVLRAVQRFRRKLEQIDSEGKTSSAQVDRE